jgi:hypothetical protein
MFLALLMYQSDKYLIIYELIHLYMADAPLLDLYLENNWAAVNSCEIFAHTNTRISSSGGSICSSSKLISDSSTGYIIRSALKFNITCSYP